MIGSAPFFRLPGGNMAIDEALQESPVPAGLSSGVEALGWKQSGCWGPPERLVHRNLCRSERCPRRTCLLSGVPFCLGVDVPPGLGVAWTSLWVVLLFLLSL